MAQLPLSNLHRVCAACFQARLTPSVLRMAGAALLLLVSGLSPVSQVIVSAAAQASNALESGYFISAARNYHLLYDYEPWQIGFLPLAMESELLAGDFAAAEQSLERLVVERPLTNDELVLKARICEGLGHTEAALQTREELWMRGIADLQTLEALADHYVSLRDWDRAYPVLLALRQAGSRNSNLLMWLGLIQAFEGPEEAVVTLARAAQIDQELANRLHLLFAVLDEQSFSSQEHYETQLGVALLAMGEMEMAETAFLRAAARNPLYGEALAYYAYVEAVQRQPALGAAQQAAAVSSDSALVNYLAGQVWKRVGEPRQARLAFERAFALDPTNPAFAIDIATTHRMEGSLSFAEIWLLEAVKIGEDDGRYNLMLAQFYIDEEYHVVDKGLPLINEILLEDPENAEVHATLGWAYFQIGDIAAAFDEMNLALSYDPDLPRALAQLGVLLESQGRAPEATGYYQRAVENDQYGPFGALARRALERLGEQ
nr:tetratricopeptide repeat protein [Anaerolineae bacterium]